MRCVAADPGSTALHIDFTAVVHPALTAPEVGSSAAGRARLDRAVRRFSSLIAPVESVAARRAASAAAKALVLSRLDLIVEDFSDELTIDTDVSCVLDSLSLTHSLS